MRYKTDYTVQDNQLFFKGQVTDTYVSHGYALAALNIVESAYNHGFDDAKKRTTKCKNQHTNQI
jgi:hypothetical protein